MRPEHLEEALLAPRRSVMSGLLRAVARLVVAGHSGSLPPAAGWLTQSRLVFLRKPGTETPRPIRVGEVWRRLVAKRLVADNRTSLQQLLVRSRQCGVALPGGADVLVHLRRCLEEAAESSEEAVAVLDLDLRNAFPSLEWHAVRAAVARDAPEVMAWTEWCHGRSARIRLPDRSWTEADRGAEQGDPLGPVYCALTLRGVAERARQAVEESGRWVWDAWYMYDGQVCLPTSAVGVYLAAFYSALAEVGGTRVADGEFKSAARLCGSPSARAAVDAQWADAASSSCKILGDKPMDKVLGGGIHAADAAAQFRAATEAVRATCGALREIDDPAVELALLRMSSNVCKVTHLLRAVGPALGLADVLAFDENLEAALSATLGGPTVGTALERATCGAREGGLGLRRAAEIRLPAFVATCLPADFSSALFARWDSEVAAAMGAWQAELAPGAAAVARQLVDDGARHAQRRAWQVLGELPADVGPVAGGVRGHASLLTPVGFEDVERPARAPDALQTRLCGVAADGKVARIL